MAYQPLLSNFTNCCGIYIPNTFFKNEPKTAKDLGLPEGYSDTVDRVKAYNIVNDYFESSDEEWAKRIRKYLEDLIKEWDRKKSYFLAVLNAKEKEVLEPVFLSLGWEILVPETRNPTGTTITLYIYHLLPKENKEVKSILSA